MFETIKNTLKKTDYILLLILLSLAVVSIVAIYSGTYNVNTDTASILPKRQMAFYGFGIIAFFGISFIGYMRIEKIAIPLYIVGCAVLVLVLVVGAVGMGAQRWLQVGPFRGQPSEFFKVVWIIILGKIFINMHSAKMGFLSIFTKFFWVIPPFILVQLQPDLGTSLTYVVVLGMVIMMLGIRWKVLVSGIIVALMCMPLMWVNLKDYQKMRIQSFVSPEKYTVSGSYQAIQSKIAIGSGGLTGKGYLKGTQSRLQFMPERHTDFIYSVINEEFGLLGGFTVLFLFGTLILRVLGIAASLREPQGKIICVAVASFIFFHVVINVGMTVGIMPVVGIPLPFISYGGSSLLTFMLMMGLVNSTYVTRNLEK